MLTMRDRWLIPSVIAASLVLVCSQHAFAQASLQVPLQFDFLNPGARSLALGGAFTGLADDATSAFTNPAGLVILGFPEVSFEGRFRRFESSFLSGGRLSGIPTNQGIDTQRAAVYGESLDESAGPSYMSFVFPKGNWAVSGYRHEFVRLDQSFEASGVFQGEGLRELALRASRKMDITAYGISGAFRANPRISVGASLVFYDFALDAQFGRFTSGFFSAPTFAPSTEIGRAGQSGDSSGVGFNVGGLFTLRQGAAASSGPEVILGAVYRYSPKLAFTGFEGDITSPVARDGEFQAPDTITGGLAMRFGQGATVTVDISRVNYQTLIDTYVAPQTASSEKGANFSVDNATEIHAGFEYVLPTRGSPALRIGTWYDPDHSIRYNVPANPDALDQRFGAYLPGADDAMHLTLGGGAAISKQFEVNAAADLSSRSRIVSISAVIRFAK